MKSKGLDLVNNRLTKYRLNNDKISIGCRLYAGLSVFGQHLVNNDVTKSNYNNNNKLDICFIYLVNHFKGLSIPLCFKVRELRQKQFGFPLTE